MDSETPISYWERKFFKELYRPWFRGKDFTSDWASNHLASWRRVLKPYRREPLRILEIGSWEGRSAIFFLRFFPNARITCIDTFEGGTGVLPATTVNGVESRFDANLREFNGRYKKLKMPSTEGLALLKEQGRVFDLAYIDGAHDAEQITIDSEGTWQLLATGGHIIWDDYLGGRFLKDPPKTAIDDFCEDHRFQFSECLRGYQLIIRKL